MKTSSLACAFLVAAAACGCSQPTENAASEHAAVTEGDPMIVDPIDASMMGTYASTQGQIARLTLSTSDPASFMRLDRVDPRCAGDDCETREVDGVWDLAHDALSGQRIIRFYGSDFQEIDEYAFNFDGTELRLAYDRAITRLFRVADPPHEVVDPIDPTLCGSYSSTSGPVAKLTLSESDPVHFVRVDRVDPSCTGDACETVQLEGVWDLAHYTGSLTKVIRFYGADMNVVDEFAYERDGDVLRLVRDREVTNLTPDGAPSDSGQQL